MCKPGAHPFSKKTRTCILFDTNNQFNSFGDNEGSDSAWNRHKKGNVEGNFFIRYKMELENPDPSQKVSQVLFRVRGNAPPIHGTHPCLIG